jgi:hypothetical protein
MYSASRSGGPMGCIASLAVMVLMLGIVLFLALLIVSLWFTGRLLYREYVKRTDLAYALPRLFNAPVATRLEDAFDYWFYLIWDTTDVNFTASAEGVLFGAWLICQGGAVLTAGALWLLFSASSTLIWGTLLLGTACGLFVGAKLTSSTRQWFPSPYDTDVSPSDIHPARADRAESETNLIFPDEFDDLI